MLTSRWYNGQRTDIRAQTTSRHNQRNAIASGLQLTIETDDCRWRFFGRFGTFFIPIEFLFIPIDKFRSNYAKTGGLLPLIWRRKQVAIIEIATKNKPKHTSRPHQGVSVDRKLSLIIGTILKARISAWLLAMMNSFCTWFPTQAFLPNIVNHCRMFIEYVPGDKESNRKVVFVLW